MQQQDLSIIQKHALICTTCWQRCLVCDMPTCHIGGHDQHTRIVIPPVVTEVATKQPSFWQRARHLAQSSNPAPSCLTSLRNFNARTKATTIIPPMHKHLTLPATIARDAIDHVNIQSYTITIQRLDELNREALEAMQGYTPVSRIPAQSSASDNSSVSSPSSSS